jgi:uncharacterized membrane protein
MATDTLSGPRQRLRSIGWLETATLVLCVLGLADSGYQVYTHYTGTGLLGCSASGDPCVLVQHSPQSYVFGIPVAVLAVRVVGPHPGRQAA